LRHISFFSAVLYVDTTLAKTVTTLSQKKFPLKFKLSVTLSDLNRFSKFLHCWKAHEICYKIHTTY